MTDANVLFDPTTGLNGLNQTFSMNSGSITVNLNMGAANVLGAGYLGTGTLTIQNGISVTSASGYLGYETGSSGTATIAGAGSTWINSGILDIGYGGSGTMKVLSGGSVSSSGTVYIGGGNGIGGSGAAGTVTVDGTGGNSKWTNVGIIHVGSGGGNAVLNITNGGVVTGSTTFYVDFSPSGAQGCWCPAPVRS